MEPNKEYINYLNALQNVNAGNQNAITELSITNKFFPLIMVEREVGSYIVNSFKNNEAHIFILTGHAGDGKTGLLYQTLRSWDVIKPGDKMFLSNEVITPEGKHVRYIKDFSELEPDKRTECLLKAKEDINKGISTFLVANTGPLINSFDKVFSDTASADLLEAIDGNGGEVLLYDGIPISVVNVATIDNSSFVVPFLKNVLSEELWGGCQSCSKKEYCPIYSNRRLMSELSDRVNDFVVKHYIYQQEYGEKLTIRQIVAHLGFTITGGLSCEKINNSETVKFLYLFTNNFFGYRGTEQRKNALLMKAIKDISRSEYDRKRLRADETLFIKDDFSSVFTNEINDLLDQAGKKVHYSEKWQQAVRRAYMFLSIDPDVNNRKQMIQDVFSVWFPRYLQLRDGEPVTMSDKSLIQDALQMLFTDRISDDEKEIPITMKRETGVSQSVQLVYGTISTRRIKIKQSEVKDFSNTKRYRVYLYIDKDLIDTCITLPLFDYFEEIRRGAISIDIDPMLSQGIDSLKAQIVSKCESDRTEMELLTMSDRKWDSIVAEYDSGNWIIG